MQRIWRRIGAFAAAETLLFGSVFCSNAEEVIPSGYHIYDIQEDQSTDTWYSAARGVYLYSGISKLLKDSEPGYAICSGTTTAHRECDRVYVRIYLDQSDTGTEGWGTIDYWTGITYEDTVAMTDSDSYPITRNKYYRVKGIHSVIKDDTVETTTTCTNALRF
ncbi:MAG: hypothetical protein HFI92_01080 [Lachnospiraceae bacterium]|nr:hypothetical protein [Lachnospiraceae bacterium]